MDRDLLFFQDSLDDVLRHRDGELKTFVAKLDADAVLNTPVVDMVERVVEQFEVECPTLRLDDRYTPGAKDVQIDVTGDFRRATWGPGPHYIDGTEIAMHVPFDGDAAIFKLRPQSWSSAFPRGEANGHELIMRVSAPADSLNMAVLKQELESQLTRITEHLATSRGQIERFNANLRGAAESLITQRREKVLKDRQLEEFLAVPVGRRPQPARILAVDVPRRSSGRPPATINPFKPEPGITRDDYAAIVNAIASFGRAAERFPHTFGPMPEPVLREILLVVLNNQFGDAVGEMFSRQGKTDIAILNRDGPVFIAECKIWGGAAEFAEAIGQLLGYVVWRDTKIAIVLFVKNRDVTEIIRKATGVLADDPRHKRPGQAIGEQPVFVLRHPDDTARELEIALVAVPVPTRAPATDAGEDTE